MKFFFSWYHPNCGDFPRFLTQINFFFLLETIFFISRVSLSQWYKFPRKSNTHRPVTVDLLKLSQLVYEWYAVLLPLVGQVHQTLTARVHHRLKGKASL